PRRAGDANTAVPKPSDAQLAYFLARFVTDVRSLSTDPIVVRRNWSEALAFATDEQAQLLNAALTDSNWFGQIGSRAITVEVHYVVRASSVSFEVSWREQTFEKGVLVATVQFTGTASLILKALPAGEMLSENPIGLYVQDFRWSSTPQ